MPRVIRIATRPVINKVRDNTYSSPLCDFHRESFYAVLEMGELELVAEFVDSLRQYGCTPENELQVHDGTKHLIDIFHAGGD